MSVTFEARALDGLEQLGLATARGQLDGAAQRAAAEQWSYTHFLGYLLDGELQERQRKCVELNLKFAHFPYRKQLQDFDFSTQPGLDRRLIDELATQIWELRAGRLEVHKGGYTSYLAAREAALKRAKEENTVRRRPPAGKPAPSLTAAASAAVKEAEIEDTERALQRLGEELASATVAQQWDRVRYLKRQYERTQSALDALLVQWEALAVT